MNTADIADNCNSEQKSDSKAALSAAEKRERIYLIGFMGTGKSSIGKSMCCSSGRTLIDTDSLIEAKCGMKTELIFQEKGEEYFREVERECLLETLKMKNIIISTGGGMSVYKDNLQIMLDNGFVAALTAKPEEIASRLALSDTKRPLLSGEGGTEKIISLMEKRAYYYMKADIIVNTSGRFISDIADEILKKAGLK